MGVQYLRSCQRRLVERNGHCVDREIASGHVRFCVAVQTSHVDDELVAVDGSHDSCDVPFRVQGNESRAKIVGELSCQHVGIGFNRQVDILRFATQKCVTHEPSDQVCFDVVSCKQPFQRAEN